MTEEQVQVAGPVEQHRAPDGLEEWVRWLVRTFDPAGMVVGSCWKEHPALVAELSALHEAHRAAEDEAQAAEAEGRASAARLGFLEDLDHSLGRIERRWDPGCVREAAHRSDRQGWADQPDQAR